MRSQKWAVLTAAVFFAGAFFAKPLAQNSGGIFDATRQYLISGAAWEFAVAPTITSAGTVVSTTATQTLTNKTLTSPTITGATLTTATITAPTISAPTITGVGASETKFCTTEFVAVTGTTGATLTNIVGLTGFALDAAGIYQFEIHLATVGTTNSGVKVGLGYTTLTATSIQSTAVGTAAAAVVTQMTTTSTTGMTLYGSTTATMDVTIRGRLIVNAAGTVAIQAAQNAAHADETKVLVGSYATFRKIG